MDIKYYLELLFEYRWEILAIIIILRWGGIVWKDLVFTPLAGGNGKVQMDELAKFVVIVSFVFSSYIEGSRKHEWRVFSDAYWFALLGSVCLIGGLKNTNFHKYLGVPSSREKHKEQENEQQPVQIPQPPK